MSRAKKSRSRGSTYYSRVIRKDPCVFCGGESRYDGHTVDHIHPTSKGGMNNWMNFAPACGRCNNRKGSLSLLETLMGMPRNAASLLAYQEWENHGALPDRWFDPLQIYPYTERRRISNDNF